MNIEEIRKYCISKRGCTESFPFGDTTLVFKVANKMFALTNLEGELSINVKCNPQKAIELREQFSAVIPGYHMNKKHWNTVLIDGTIHQEQIKEWIDNSYDLVLQSLPKRVRVL